MGKISITVRTQISAPIEKVWKCWTSPEDIIHWNAASEDWHTTRAENNLEIGGKFSYRMEAKDGSFGFDFWGIYDKVIFQKSIEITLGDGRKMQVLFTDATTHTEVIETFEAEDENTIELQEQGWQLILNNFKKYIEQKYL